jgi:hypothetical protein
MTVDSCLTSSAAPVSLLSAASSPSPCLTFDADSSSAEEMQTTANRSRRRSTLQSQRTSCRLPKSLARSAQRVAFEFLDGAVELLEQGVDARNLLSRAREGQSSSMLNRLTGAADEVKQDADDRKPFAAAIDSAEPADEFRVP